MAVQQDIAGLQGGKRGGVEVMAMGGKHHPASQPQDAGFRHDGKFQHHLVHFGIAVSTDAQKPVFLSVQQGNHFLWRVSGRQIVPRAMIEKIPEKKKAVRLFPFEGVEHFTAVKSGAVYIGSDHDFHIVTIPFFSCPENNRALFLLPFIIADADISVTKFYVSVFIIDFYAEK